MSGFGLKVEICDVGTFNLLLQRHLVTIRIILN
jgi:hypothetical protein